MKLQTRVIWITCLVVTAAMFVSDICIWNLMRSSIIREALMRELESVQQEVNEVTETWNTLSHNCEYDNQSEENQELLNYILKKQDDDYLICADKSFGSETITGEIIYNRTTLTKSDLVNLKYDVHGSYEYAILKKPETTYYVFHAIDESLNLYILRDVGYINEKLGLLALGMLGILIIITVLMVVVMHVLINRAFAPIKELSKSAKNYGEGNYDTRIEVKKRDEIGELSDNFNRMADAIEQRTRDLEESEKRKTLFMGGLTHELKTPMTSISGYAQTLLMTKLNVEEQEEALNYIYKECRRLERLSNKMIELLSLEHTDTIRMTECSVGELFRQTKNTCKTKLVEQGVTLYMKEQGETVMADFDLMLEVLVNLVNNGVKACKNGGEIRLIFAKSEDGQPYMVVKDTGCGIPVEEIDKIMEPFYMLDKSRSRRDGGAGLGLTLVKMILDRQNMKLVINSEVGVGTEMKIFNIEDIC